MGFLTFATKSALIPSYNSLRTVFPRTGQERRRRRSNRSIHLSLKRDWVKWWVGRLPTNEPQINPFFLKPWFFEI